MQNFKEPRVARTVEEKKRIEGVSPKHTNLVKAIVLREYWPEINKWANGIEWDPEKCIHTSNKWHFNLVRQEKHGLFHKVVLKQLDICKKKKSWHLLHIIHRNHSIQIADLNVKSKTVKLLEENIVIFSVTNISQTVHKQH